jgi:uncharacterized membrane protein
MERDKVYLIIMIVSFVYSAHTMSYYQNVALAILLVDIGILGINILFLIIIECLTKKNHLSAVKIKRGYEVVIIIICVTYGVYTATIAVVSNTERFKKN